MDLSRRRLLKWGAGGGLAYSIGQVVESVVLGYGTLVGTNLTEQAADGSLAELAGEGFQSRERYVADLDGTTLRIENDQIAVSDGERVRRAVEDLEPTAAARIDERFGLSDRPVSELARDLPAVAAGEVAFTFHDAPGFFERLDGDGVTPRPFTTGVVRGPRYRTPDPEVVEAFAGVDPARPRKLVDGLARAFRRRTDYDLPRYLAGAVYFNVLLGTVDVREPFREDVSMDAIADDGGRLFCTEYTWRSIEAFHSVPARRQRRPVVAVEVLDDRHRHVYTGLASVVRVDDRLEVAMTFLDYMHATLYDDFDLRGVLGDGEAGYTDRHRATDVIWGH